MAVSSQRVRHLRAEAGEWGARWAPPRAVNVPALCRLRLYRRAPSVFPTPDGRLALSSFAYARWKKTCPPLKTGLLLSLLSRGRKRDGLVFAV